MSSIESQLLIAEATVYGFFEELLAHTSKRTCKGYRKRGADGQECTSEIRPQNFEWMMNDSCNQKENTSNAQSTSSIFDASSAAPSTSSSGGRSSSSPNPSSSSSMLRPSLIIRWMRPANCVGSSKLKPEVSNDVSKSSQIRSLTVLSDLSAAAFFLSSDMIECFGLTSIVFLDTM